VLLDSGCVTLSKSSSLPPVALARAMARMTAVGEPTGTAPSAPAPARRGTDGPPADAAGP
jgi:hypothetical protein